MTPISALSSMPADPSRAPTKTKSSFGVNTQDFLTLLVAQSKYQDPLSPSDPGDTLQQLASLAQVSGLQDVKAALERLLGSQQRSFDAASWIGRSALVPSTTAMPLADGTYAGEASVDSAGSIDVTFSSQDGIALHTEHIAGTVSGRVGFSWSGLANGVQIKAPLKVTATAGEAPVGVSIWTHVESVRQPAQSEPVIETPVGVFAPAAVIDLK